MSSDTFSSMFKAKIVRPGLCSSKDPVQCLQQWAQPCLHGSFWQSTKGASRLYRCSKSKQKCCSLSNAPFQHRKDVGRCLLEREIENAKRFCLEIQSQCNKDYQTPTSSGEGKVCVFKVCYYLLTIYYITWKMQLKHQLELQCKECSIQWLTRGPRHSLSMVTCSQSGSALCRQGLWLSSGSQQHRGAQPFLRDTDKHLNSQHHLPALALLFR